MHANLKKIDDTAAEAVTPAVTEAEALLGKADLLATTLRETAVAISEGLGAERRLSASLGSAEVHNEKDVARQLGGQLAAVHDRREGAIRRRRAASEELLLLESELLQARRGVNEVRYSLAGAAVAELQKRWDATVMTMGEIYNGVEELGRIMQTRVDLGAPYRVTTSVVTGAPGLQFVAAATAPPATLPTALVALTTLIERLDSAAAVVSAVKASHEMDARHRRLCMERRTDPNMPSVYVVVKSEVSHWGSVFPRGALLDRTIVNDANLYRLSLARSVVVADQQTTAIA